MAAKKLLILPGDGIGQEVMVQVRRIIDWMAKKRNVSFDIAEGLIGDVEADIPLLGHPEIGRAHV